MRRIERPSPNHDARPDGAAIDMLVLHYTGMKSASEALARLCDPSAKVSAHYTIDEEGTVYAHVPEARRTWHAGVAYWAGASDINALSIGIELVNPGHEFGYREFATAQIVSLINTLPQHPAAPSHSLKPSAGSQRCGTGAQRKIPASCFPGCNWPRRASACGRMRWPVTCAPKPWLASAMTRTLPLDKVIAAFQRHFRPQKLDGQWDTECAGLLAWLLTKPGV